MKDLRKIYNELPEGVSLQMHGRYGYLYFKNIYGYIEFYVELSGVPQYQFLVWFETVSVWTFPSNIEISTEVKLMVKSKLIEFLEQNGITSDIYPQ